MSQRGQHEWARGFPPNNRIQTDGYKLPPQIQGRYAALQDVHDCGGIYPLKSALGTGY